MACMGMRGTSLVTRALKNWNTYTSHALKQKRWFQKIAFQALKGRTKISQFNCSSFKKMKVLVRSILADYELEIYQQLETLNGTSEIVANMGIGKTVRKTLLVIHNALFSSPSKTTGFPANSVF